MAEKFQSMIKTDSAKSEECLIPCLCEMLGNRRGRLESLR
jgi:hypothetical protein